MDILEELPVEQWSHLKMKLRKLWPLNLPAYCTLTLNLKCPKILERVRAVMQFEKFVAGTAKMYHLATTKPFTDLRTPDNTYLRSVKPEHIHRVDNTWRYKYSYSYTYFSTLAANGLSYGLYSTDTDELLAWIFINEYNYLCHFYCEQRHRRRGYGEFVMTCAINDIL